MASTGSQPKETITKLRELNYPTVLGNADAYLLNPDPGPTSSTRHNIELNQLFEINGWCAKMLSKADLDYLRTFKPTIEVSLGGDATLLCFHGSPRSNNEEIRSTTPDEELEKILSGFKATIMAGGHTHTDDSTLQRDAPH